MTFPGIVVALDAEARNLIAGPMVSGKPIHLKEGPLLRISGSGAVRAKLAAEFLVQKGATSLVTWGSAGGLHVALSPGSLVIPEKILLPDNPGFAVDAAWHERLCYRLGKHFELHTQPLFQCPFVVTSTSMKRSLFNEHGAIAVDMESAAVAEVAQRAEVPFVAIRAISDPADMVLPTCALEAVDEHGRTRPLRLLRSLARHPKEFPILLLLRRNFTMAQNTLSSVWDLTDGKLLAH